MSYAVASANLVRAKTSTGLFGIHHIMAVRSKGLESGGETTLFGWIMMPGHNITRMTASMGYDTNLFFNPFYLQWVMIDCEHGNFSDATMHESIAIVAAQPGCSPWVRIPDAQNWMVKRALDAGAHGLLVPFMNSAEEARKFVSYTKFPVPKADGGGGGSRGIGSPFSPYLFNQTMGEYFRSANRDIFVAVQIESREGVDNCEDIAAVEGVDAVVIGPNDLASQLGYVATDHESIPEVQEAIERVLQACKKANKYCGMFCTSPEDVRRHFDQGFDFMNLGGDWVALGEWNANARRALKDLL
ncbi:BQ2448_5984 [Microbotryum intermedium]|uniref:BQ2448_5984 protein n=1 Tax=Microbotryum intermedium TaxID=269621 RepID=A0A238F837_9BASI|nr:BQ2448_5984 [Microbotryum intermedium]